MCRFDILGSTRNALLISDPEKLISYGRLVTAAFAIVAIYLDPTQPVRFRSETQITLAFYASFSILLMLFPIRKPVNSAFHFPVHLLDTAVLGLLAFLTNELTSPFFSFLPFTLLAMTIRWGLFGAFAGAIILEIALLAIGIPDILDGESELNFLIIRTAYFFLSAAMLAYFAAYREGSQARLTRLANWQTELVTTNRGDWITQLCGHAADVMGSKHLIALWREQERAIGEIVVWDSGVAQQAAVDGDANWDLIDQHLLSAIPTVATNAINFDKRELIAKILSPHFDRFPTEISSGFLAAFSSVRFRGAVWIFDPDCRPEEALVLIDIISAKINAELERFDLMRQISDNIRTEERSRLARDMHDSVLQDLTATNLKLHALSGHGAPVPNQLRDIEQILTQLQRRVRMFVEEQKYQAIDEPLLLSEALLAQAEELRRIWGIAITIDRVSGDVQLTSSFLREIHQLISEATANAVRHGQANQMIILAQNSDDHIKLRIWNDGQAIDKTAAPHGPLSLRSRIVDLDGNITFKNQTIGLEILMTIPIPDPVS